MLSRTCATRPTRLIRRQLGRGAHAVAVRPLTPTNSFATHATATSVSSNSNFTTLHGQYDSTIQVLQQVQLGSSVLVLGTGKASQFHNKVAQSYGTNIISAVAPKKGGTEFLGKPVFNTVKEAVAIEMPLAASVFVPPVAAADAVLECIEAEIPLIVSVAEGIPTRDQLRIQAALRSQNRSRLVGPNCPGLIIPRAKFKLGIQPLSVHSVGNVGLASRSGTISYELASQTSSSGLGQSVVFGLGGDPFPGTRTWEALKWMLEDENTKVICIVGEIGGQMEEEAADYLIDFRRRHPELTKPVVGFIAGQSADAERLYGHAGAVWYSSQERAQEKIAVWQRAGIRVAEHIGAIGGLIEQSMADLK